MIINELLKDLQANNITIGFIDGKLKVFDPQKNLTDDLMIALKENKPELISLLSEGEGYTRSDFPWVKLNNPDIARLQRQYPRLQNLYVATPMQQGMLFHGLLDGTGESYTSQNYCDLVGDLDLFKLQQAWQQVVQRHDIFRTCFVGMESEQVHQLVVSDVKMPFRILDWRTLPEHEQIAKLAALRQDDKAKGFDFSVAPLMRVTVIRLGPGRYHLLWSHHHVLSDGWCTPVILMEVLNIYQAKMLNTEISLPGAVPYENYIGWLFQQDRQKANDFWSRELTDIQGPTPLFPHRTQNDMTDLSHEKAQSHKLVLSETVSLQLNRLAQDCHTTMNVVFQVAWAYLLYRYSREQQVIFGTTVSGRPPELPGVEKMIGLFINTVPVKVDFSDNLTLREQLTIQHTNNARRDEYAYLALSDIQRICHNGSHSRLNALFDTIIVFENAPGADVLAAAEFDMLDVENVGSSEQTNYGLTMTVYCQQQLEVNFSYWPDRISESDMQYIELHLEQILRAMASGGSEQLVRQIPLLSKQEKQQQLIEWRRDTRELPVIHCIHQRLEQIAAASPDSVAVVFEQWSLTWQDLNRQANQIAHRLLASDVSQGDIVGVCTGRSLDMVVAMLGVLKAGAAYLPLDPKYPAARLNWMLEDSGADIVVGSESWQYLLDDSDVTFIDLDNRTELETFPSTNPSRDLVDVQPDDLAYIIYTSGSTGTPKGVMIEHKNVLRLLASTESQFGFSAEDVWTVFHSYAFDFSVWEIWVALLSGAKTVVVSYDVSRSPEHFAQLVIDEGVTILNQTPSAFYSFSEEMVRIQGRHALRFIIFGGEAVDFGRLAEWYRHYSSQTQLVNMYGITETTVHSTLYKIDHKDAVTERNCIGRPLTDLTMMVVNQDMDPQPVGVPGELLIAGGGLARGYLNRDDLTAARFIQLSLDGQAHRFYRTGDLVSWLPGGELAYHGRIDKQVKIRGFRIEPGEIESQLTQTELVKDAVVRVKRDFERVERIVAYVIFQPDAQIPDDWRQALRDVLRDHLPDYMIPQAFVSLDRIPMTVNGKLDEQALPKPDYQQQGATNYKAPVTKIQKQLCELWQNVLGIEKPGITDNYFAIGGDSIMSIQMVSQARTMGLNLSVKQLFEAQTIEVLAERLESGEAEEAKVERTDCEPFELLTREEADYFAAKHAGEFQDVYPLSALQAGMVFHSQLDPGSAIYHDVFSYHLELKWDELAFRQALINVINEHEVLRTAFLFSGERPLQCVYGDIELPLFIENISHKSPVAQQRYLKKCQQSERHKPFDWDKPPLFRIYIYRRAVNRFQYVFSFHHGILDGWSVARFNSQLFSYYEARLRGKGLPRPPELPAFREFIAAEQAAIHSSRSRQYWHQLLDGAVVTRIPELPRPQQHQETVCIDVDVKAVNQLSEKIISLSRSLAMPIQHLLLAVHVKVLSLISGEGDVTTCVVNNGRIERDGGEQSLGLFLNSLPFRWNGDNCNWKELIRDVNRHWLDNLQYRHYPMSEIQRETGLDLSATVFNYTHFHAYQDVLEQGSVRVLGVDSFEQTNFTFCANFNRQVKDDSLSLTLLYNPALIDATTIKRLSGWYANGFRNMLSHLNNTHISATILGREERRLLLSEWNSAVTLPPQEVNVVHQLVEARVDAFPGATALRFGDESLTYQQMDVQANKLARHLQRCGVSVGDVVGLSIERSMDMITCLLAILKVGAAYVPLDPEYPPMRLKHMIEDSHMVMLITQSHLTDRFDHPQLSKVLIDSPENLKQFDGLDGSRITTERPIEGGDLAWIIYTSGSTGMPKGVMCEHRGVVNLARSQQYLFKPARQHRMLHFASLSFDAASWEWIMALTNGASLSVVSEEQRQSTIALSELLLDHRITHATIPPSLLPHLPLHDDYDIQGIYLGGEACDEETAMRWAEKYPMYNVYGPTETTICATSSRILSDKPLSIGRPLPGLRAYVLDKNLQLLPVGATGELFIGGVGLARGYVNRAELTRDKFLVDPFVPGGKARMYRTGDRVKYLENGNLMFMGREDHQVKVRGFRIEPGEIISILAQQSQVLEATVTTIGVAGDKSLVAYIAPDPRWRNALNDDEERLSLINTLKAALSEHLPDYMIPAAWIMLDRLPISPNGKVDRNRLPGPNDTDFMRPAYEAPQSAAEQTLTSIWEKVLRVSKVGRHDDFFDGGGHSLLVIKLITLVHQRLGFKLSVRDIYEAPTPALLSQLIDQRSRSIQPWKPLVNVQPQKRFFRSKRAIPDFVGTMYLVPGLGMMSPAYQQFADALFPHITLNVLESRGMEPGHEPHQSMAEMVEDYKQAVLTDLPEGRIILGGHSFGGSVVFELARALEEHERDVLVMIFDSVLYAPEGLSEEITVDKWLDDILVPEVNAQTAVNTLTRQELANTGLKGAVDVARAQLEIYRHYRPGGELNGHVVLFYAEQGGVAEDGVDEVLARIRPLCRQGTVALPARGGHYSMFHHQYVRDLADSLIDYCQSD